jgi:quinol monooxygenase YgiN
MIKHIRMWRLVEPKQENIAAAKAALEACRGIVPGMLTYEVGIDIGIDQGPCDLALYSEFTDRAALRAYEEHPAHLQLKAVLAPLRESRAAIDYEA